MAFLSTHDFKQAESEGRFSAVGRDGGHLPFSAFSLDLRVGRIFRRAHYEVNQERELALPEEEFIARCLEEVKFPFVMPSHGFFFMQPEEELMLVPGFAGSITSRSSWARNAVAVRDMGQLKDGYGSVFRGRPLCSFRSVGAPSEINKGDAVGQLFVYDSPVTFPIFGNELKYLISSKKLIIEDRGREQRVADLNFYEGGVMLHQGSDILVYSNGLLKPGFDVDDCFRRVGLSGGSVVLPTGQYFISASREKISIPEGYVGYVHETHPGQVLRMHANAPYIASGRVMSGTITFENTMKIGAVLREGDPITTLHLHKLITPLGDVEKSRYDGQNGATASRLE